MVKHVFLCYSYIGFVMQRVPHHERVCDIVPDELREVWSKYSFSAILPAASRILRDTSHSVEC